MLADCTRSGGRASACNVGSPLSATAAALTVLFCITRSLGEAAGSACARGPEGTRERPQAPVAGGAAVCFYGVCMQSGGCSSLHGERVPARAGGRMGFRVGGREEGRRSRVEGSRGEEEHGVTEVIKDWEGADTCLESDTAGPNGQRRTPLSKKLYFL